MPSFHADGTRSRGVRAMSKRATKAEMAETVATTTVMEGHNVMAQRTIVNASSYRCRLEVSADGDMTITFTTEGERRASTFVIKFPTLDLPVTMIAIAMAIDARTKADVRTKLARAS